MPINTLIDDIYASSFAEKRKNIKKSVEKYVLKTLPFTSFSVPELVRYGGDRIVLIGSGNKNKICSSNDDIYQFVT